MQQRPAGTEIGNHMRVPNLVEERRGHELPLILDLGAICAAPSAPITPRQESAVKPGEGDMERITRRGLAGFGLAAPFVAQQV
jgi:hypothetical protein